MSVPQQLIALGIPEKCVQRLSSAEENRRRFSISPHTGDVIWRVHMDGCWLQSGDQKRVDYIFWCQSASGRSSVLLVELKGKHFGKALDQIEVTLQLLCKSAQGDVVHAAIKSNSPGHDPPATGGVRAFVILRKGENVPQVLTKRQRRQQKAGLSQALMKRRRLQMTYGVIVYPHSQELRIDGLDALPGQSQ